MALVLAGSETEAVVMIEAVESDGGKHYYQATALDDILILGILQKKYFMPSIYGETEEENIAKYKRLFSEDREASRRLNDTKEEVRRALENFTFSPWEGLAPQNGGRAYLEFVGPYPEWCTPICSLPSEILLQERIWECIFARICKNLSKNNKIFHLFKNSTDGKGHSQGNHNSFCISRNLASRIFAMSQCRVSDKIFIDDLSGPMQDLITFDVLRLPFISSGKPGSELYEASYETHYQMSQRSDHLGNNLVGSNTVYNRPLINVRDEPLAEERRFFRLHDIHSEGSNRSPQAVKMRFGIKQIYLGMMEEDLLRLDWYLASPLETLHDLSRDLTLSRPIPIVLRHNRKVVERTPLALLKDIAKQMEIYAATANLPLELSDYVGDFSRLIGLFQENSPELSKVIDWKIKEKLIRVLMPKKGLNPDNPQHWKSNYAERLHINYHSLTDERVWMAAAEICEVKEAEDYFEKNIPDVLFPPATTSAFLKGFLANHPYLSRLATMLDWHVIRILLPSTPEWLISIPDPHLFHRAEVVELKNGLGMIDTPELAKEFFKRIYLVCKNSNHGNFAI